MTPVPSVTLPNGVVYPPHIVASWCWGGREQGLRWVEHLPELLASICAQHRVTLSPEMPRDSLNLVLFGTSQIHGDIVIKLSPPHPEVTAEFTALESAGSVDIIAQDDRKAALIMRRISPGYSLRDALQRGDLTDEAATEIAARLLHSWWRPTNDTRLIPMDEKFAMLVPYIESHRDGSSRIPLTHLSAAHDAIVSLLADPGLEIGLHGDMHHDNVLYDERSGWTAIDPKGLRGDPGFEIAPWMVNPVGVDQWPNLVEVTDRRLTQFSELLGIERQRLWQWSVAYAVLNDAWRIEQSGATNLYCQPTVAALLELD